MDRKLVVQCHGGCRNRGKYLAAESVQFAVAEIGRDRRAYRIINVAIEVIIKTGNDGTRGFTGGKIADLGSAAVGERCLQLGFLRDRRKRKLDILAQALEWV